MKFPGFFEHILVDLCCSWSLVLCVLSCFFHLTRCDSRIYAYLFELVEVPGVGSSLVSKNTSWGLIALSAVAQDIGLGKRDQMRPKNSGVLESMLLLRKNI